MENIRAEEMMRSILKFEELLSADEKIPVDIERT
jgi:hypothetical protein